MKSFLIILTIALGFIACTKDKYNSQKSNTAPPFPTVSGNWTTTSFSFSLPEPVTSISVKDTVICATNGYALLRSNNNGTSWVYTINGCAPYKIWSTGTNIYGDRSCVPPYIWSSIDKGYTWATKSGTGDFPNCFIISNNILYEGTANGVNISSDGGDNWLQINTGLPANQPINCFATKDTNVFAGAKGVYVLNQQNYSWTSVTNGLPSDAFITALAVSGNNIFAGTGKYNTNAYGMYFSNDNGTTWNPINHGFPQNDGHFLLIQSILISSSSIFVLAGNRIYLSKDSGNSWAQVIGIPSSNPGILSIAANDSVLYAGGGNIIDANPDIPQTDGKVWKCPLNSLQ